MSAQNEDLILYRLSELAESLRVHEAEEKKEWDAGRKDRLELRRIIEDLRVSVEHRLTKIEANSAMVAGVISIILGGFIAWLKHG